MQEVVQISGDLIVTLFFVIVVLVGVVLFIAYMMWRKVGGDFVKDILLSAQTLTEELTGQSIKPLNSRMDEISSGVDMLVKFLIGKGIGLTMLIAMQHPSIVALMNSAPEIAIAVKEILFNDYAGNKQRFMKDLLNKFDVKGSVDPLILQDEGLTADDYKEMRIKALDFVEQLDERIKVAGKILKKEASEIIEEVSKATEMLTTKKDVPPKARREGGIH